MNDDRAGAEFCDEKSEWKEDEEEDDEEVGCDGRDVTSVSSVRPLVVSAAQLCAASLQRLLAARRALLLLGGIGSADEGRAENEAEGGEREEEDVEGETRRRWKAM